MWRNVLLSASAMVTAGLLAGCATAKNKDAAPVAPPVADRPAPAATPPAALAQPKAPAKPREPNRKPGVTPAATPAPPAARPDVLPLVKAETSWLDYGRTFSATREQTSANANVPIFRQAIVLASVRAGLAGTPATPRAEFQNGLMTLTFDRGTPQQIAAAVNKTLDTPEVRQLRVVLPR